MEVHERDVDERIQLQALDEAAAETAREIANGWVPPSMEDMLTFQLERAQKLRDIGWDPTKIPWDDHGAVLRGEIVPDQSARLATATDVASHSWSPIDLLEFVNSPPEPPTIGGLVYPGRRHVFSGEPETLKTWAADVLCVEQIKQGAEVVYIDFEMGAREQAARLRALGCSDEEVRRFLYVMPTEPLTPTELLPAFEALLRVVQPPLIVIDAFAGALALHGADENSNTDVEHFYMDVITPMQRHGAAIVLLDHVTKNRETRGRYSIGGGRKLGGVDVHLGFEIVRPFGRGKSGLAKVITHKDRPGQLQRPKAAEIELVSNGETGSIAWQVRIAEEQPANTFRPTHLMERVSLYVAAHIGELPSRNSVEEAVKGRREYVRDAIEALLIDGYLVEEDGPRNARLLRSIRPFRESDQEVAA